MGSCPLGINPYSHPSLTGSVTVSVGSSFALRCRWAFYSVLGRFYFVVWLELQPPGRPCSPSSLPASPTSLSMKSRFHTVGIDYFSYSVNKYIFVLLLLLLCRNLPGLMPFMVISFFILSTEKK